jgi:hypothetical protein
MESHKIVELAVKDEGRQNYGDAGGEQDGAKNRTG